MFSLVVIFVYNYYCRQNGKVAFNEIYLSKNQQLLIVTFILKPKCAGRPETIA
jgi:hypothetical protein